MRLLLVLFSSLTMCMAADMSMPQWYKHNTMVRSYAQGDIERAHRTHIELVKAMPADAVTNFNEGVLLYKQGQYQSALASFKRASEGKAVLSPAQQEQVCFNSGNAYAQLQQWESALQAYEQVLALNSAHEAARHNRDIIRKIIEEKKHEQEQSNKQDNENKQSNSDKKENNAADNESPQERAQQHNSENNEQQHNNERRSQKDKSDHTDDTAQPQQGKREQAEERHKAQRQGQQAQEPEEHTKDPSTLTNDLSNRNVSRSAASDGPAQSLGDDKAPQAMQTILAAVEQQNAQEAKKFTYIKLAQAKGERNENKPAW